MTLPAVFAAAAAGSGGGCSLVTSFAGFGGDSHGDAGPSSDGQSDDGASSSGSGSGSGSGSDGGNGPNGYCHSRAAQAIFCADFDESSPTAGWIDGAFQPNASTLNGNVTLSTTMWVSPPASVQATSPSNTTFSLIDLDHPGGTYVTLHFEFDLAVDDYEGGSVLEVDFCSGACGGHPAYDFELYVNATSDACIGENGTGCMPVLPTGAAPSPAWQHVVLDASLTTSHVTGSIGTSAHFSQSLQAPPSFWTNSLLIVQFGVPSGAGSVHLDNVIVSGF